MDQNKTQEELNKVSFRDSLEDPETPPQKIDKKLLTFLLKDSGWRALRVFFIVGGIRSGVNILLKTLFHLRKKKPFQKDLLEAFIGKEVRGSCLFLGGFVFTWKFLSQILPIYHQKRTRLTDFLSGFIAGIFILAERSDRRVSFSQQLSVRAAHSFFTSLSSKNIFTIPHANSILFVLSTSQILYSYVIHHKTLPPSIYNFMVQQAQIPHFILEVNRRVISRQEIDVEAFTDLLKGMKATPNTINVISKLSPVPGVLPCVAYHPSLDSCTVTFFAKFSKVMKMILPVYAGLTFLPAIFLRFPLFKASPKEILLKCTLGSIRSSAFLATLVSVYQLAICQIRSLGVLLAQRIIELSTSLLPWSLPSQPFSSRSLVVGLSFRSTLSPRPSIAYTEFYILKDGCSASHTLKHLCLWLLLEQQCYIINASLKSCRLFLGGSLINWLVSEIQIQLLLTKRKMQRKNKI
ncbi:hypothetical protein DSO57_1006720 [Entomophthora muscae]|uniref:Uncharacterized protein n=1 Tax=Entomophthora muscae TaxID=34485 RepID=A0ACC2UUI2_9FUNG|nr:hypothetical protein DSO57_1006720 [Entomophthora muscae]